MTQQRNNDKCFLPTSLFEKKLWNELGQLIRTPEPGQVFKEGLQTNSNFFRLEVKDSEWFRNLEKQTNQLANYTLED